MYASCILPFLSVFPLGLSNPNDYVRATPVFFYTWFFLLGVSLWLTTRDTLMGLFAIYVVLSVLRSQTLLSLAVAMWVVIGCCGVLMFQQLSKPLLYLKLLGLIGCLQVVYATIQTFQLDPLFISGGAPVIFVHGTFGHHNFFGAFLSLLVPIVPLYYVPMLVVGLFLSNSLISFIAAGVGLLITYGRGTFIRCCCAGGFLLFLAWHFQTKSHDSFWSRLNMWSLALRDMQTHPLALIIGNGPGAWYMNSQKLWSTTKAYENLWHIHNEYLQAFYDLGAVGIVIVLLWMYRNRHAFKNGAFCTLVVLCCGIYPFHLASIAIVAIGVMGIATAKGEQVQCTENVSQNSAAYWV